MLTSRSAVFARLSDPNPTAAGPVLFDTAVVLGGSIAGLLAARVLSDHAATVVIIDRDDPGADRTHRAGVPQGAQVHALLPGGLRQLERWFPGFTERALVAGGRQVQAAKRLVYIGDARQPQGSKTAMLTGTRPFLEAQIRRHVLALPNVKTVNARVTGLEFGPAAVNGVRYEAGGEPGLQHADFTVDAMGRSSRLSQWLAEAGWPSPPLQRMRVQINYATALLRREKDDPDVGTVRWQSRDASSGLRGAVLVQVEDDRWQVTMSGYVDSRPGATAGDFVRLAKSALPSEFAAVAKPERIIGEIKTYRHAESVRRDFHALARFPARLVATGDAVASFNPVYGQGISSAALQASALSAYLRSDPDLARPARGFLELQQVVVDAAWDTSTTADLALPHIDGPYPRGYRLRQRISKRVRAAALHDPEIARRTDEVGFMLKHPSSLRSSGTLTRVALVGLRTNFRR